MPTSPYALIQKITIVQSSGDLKALLDDIQSLATTRPVRVAFINAHAMNMCHRDNNFLADLMACDYVLRDGSGMKILYKMLGREAGVNLNGTDLIPQILDLYTGQPVALMGTNSPYLERAGDIIAGKGGRIVGAIDGFQEDNAYTFLADQTHPALTVLAMGMPRQEKIAALLARNLNHPCLIVCGGAILDFMGGKVTRAPQFFRKVGMEWLYRLMIEPKRLFGRYVIGNGVFLCRALRMVVQSKASVSNSTH